MVKLGSGLGPILTSCHFGMCLYFAYLVIDVTVVGVIAVLFHV